MSFIRRFIACLVFPLPAVAVAQVPCSASLTLGGNGSYVQIENRASVQKADAITYEAWFRHKGKSGRIVSKGDGWHAASNRSFDMTVNGPLKRVSAEFFCQVGSRRGYWALAYTGIQPNTWIHVAATFDSAAKEQGKLYVDGKLVVARSMTAGAKLYQSTTPFFIGATPPHRGTLDGDVQFVRIWDRALTAAQVQAFRRVESAKIPGVVHCWTLNSHLLDIISGHHGKAVGSPGFTPGCATSTNFDAGTKGPFGIPQFALNARPSLGSTPSFVTDNASGKPATGILVLGTRRVARRVLGGTLLVDTLLASALSIGASGAAWPIQIPNDARLAGAAFYAQLPVFYPSVTQPAWSRGLQFTLGN